MSDYELTYKVAMCFSEVRHFKNCNNFHIHDKILKFAFSLEYVSIRYEK